MANYTKVGFEDYPSKKTPTSAANLNHMDDGIYNNSVKIEANEAAIQNLDKKVDDVSSNLSLKYNSDDDFIYILDGTNWTKWKKAGLSSSIIYDNGVKYVPLSTYAYNGGSVVLEPLIVTNSSTNGCSVVYTQNKIDLSKYSRLNVAFQNASGYGTDSWLWCGVCNTIPVSGYFNYDNVPKNIRHTGSAASGTLTLDISELSEDYYIMLGSDLGGASPARTATITKVWLE